MVQYLIIKCEKCGNFIAIRENVKSFKCPYCGVRSTVVNSSGKMKFKIYAVADGREVPKKLAELKRLEKI